MARSKLLDVDTSGMNLTQLADYRRKLAETANRQMRRWVTAGLEEKPSAYTKAESWLNRLGRDRFSTAKAPMPAETEAAQRRRELAEIAQMKQYMGSASYSKTGYEKVKKKAREGFAKAAGVDLSDKQLEILLKSESFGWLKRTVGSGVLLDVARAIAKGQSTAEEVKQKMDSVFEQYAKSAEMENAFKNRPIDELFQALGLDLDAVLQENSEDEDDEDFERLMNPKPKKAKKPKKKKSKKKSKKKRK